MVPKEVCKRIETTAEAFNCSIAARDDIPIGQGEFSRGILVDSEYAGSAGLDGELNGERSVHTIDGTLEVFVYGIIATRTAIDFLLGCVVECIACLADIILQLLLRMGNEGSG